MVSLTDVAKAAGVTRMTVSNVINGRAGRVSAATQARVLAVVAELGYEPNANARALSTARSEIIALVFLGDRGEGQSPLANPHYADLLDEIERGVAARGKQLMVHFSNDVTTTVAAMRSWNVDGAILFGANATQVLQLKTAHQAPMVFVDVYEKGLTVSRLNDELGGRLAAQRLIAAGHRRIGFLGPAASDDPNVVSLRHAGFLAALAEHGIDDYDASRLACEVNFAEARHLAAGLLADPREFTAFVTTADVIAAGLIKGFADAGLRVPDDISLTGFDDTTLAEMVTPALTTVHQDTAAKARGAVDLLFDRIGGAESTVTVIDPWIVDRESVAPPPARSRRTRAGDDRSHGNPAGTRASSA
ncbi:LacI family DNA-binding transcriptional regulator [Salana multivorans]